MQPSPPPPPSTPAASTGGQGTLILVLGILGLVCCPLLGPVAWYMGAQEMKAIKEGRAPAAQEGTVKAGWILGIIGTIVMGFWLFWVFLWGGLGVLSAIGESI